MEELRKVKMDFFLYFKANEESIFSFGLEIEFSYEQIIKGRNLEIVDEYFKRNSYKGKVGYLKRRGLNVITLELSRSRIDSSRMSEYFMDDIFIYYDIVVNFRISFSKVSMQSFRTFYADDLDVEGFRQTFMMDDLDEDLVGMENGYSSRDIIIENIVQELKISSVYSDYDNME